jgi:hypothetical protein
MKTRQQSIQPPPFQNYFQAETFLEKKGYFCENEIWKDKENHIATVVPKQNGVAVEFKH